MPQTYFPFLRAALLLAVTLCPLAAHAQTLLTTEQALKEMLPDADQIVKETCVLSKVEANNILERLKKHKIQFPNREKVREAERLEEYTFYFGLKNGVKTSVAIMEIQPGEWGEVKMIVALDPESGRVRNVAIMSFVERRGAPIAQRNFLNQFVDKGTTNAINLGEDINAITGATVSSQAACYGVNKMLFLYNELY